MEKIRIGFFYGLLNLIISFATIILMTLAGLKPSAILEKNISLEEALLLVILFPIVEEYIFRFIPIKLTKRATENAKILWVVIFISSAVFGILHGSWHHIFIQGTAGIILSLAFLRGGYWSSVIAHATLNGSIVVLLMTSRFLI